MSKKREYSTNKIVAIIMLLTMVFYTLLNIVSNSSVFAVTQTRESYSDKINNYSGYKELVDALKASHPNWNFTFLYTGLDWNQVLKNETTAIHGRNVVPASRSSAWKCASCGETPHGGSDWRCASEAAVAYYMDPRNWINESYIFEFENLSFNGEIQTVEGVQKIIADMHYMDNPTYIDTSGNTVTMSKSYAQVIVDAAREAGISPYHLASRIRQEQGAGSSPGSTATGTYSGYTGYYNYMNIGATGSTDREVIVNGLEYAKKHGWTSPEISIKEGAKSLANNYIKDGQDTLYLQKFDVDYTDGELYWYQYMQNLSAAVTEGAQVRSTYANLGLLNSSIEFVIPVYENMPKTASPEPVDASLVTHNITSTGDDVSIRNAPAGSLITSVNKGDKMLRIELAETTVSGRYWDKVVLSDGTKGYMARDYIQLIDLYTNCNETMVTNTSVNLRNGPGTSGTSIITTLSEGQIVTRIEKNMYNLDGYVWDRITLPDGRGGYIAQEFLSAQGSTNPNTGTVTTSEIVRVICKSGLKVRVEPGTDKSVLTFVEKNTLLTRTKANASNADGYIWDKIITPDGLEGYVARGDSTEQYIEVVNSSNGGSSTSTGNGNMKIENSSLVCIPATTVDLIKATYSDAKITNKNGEVVNSGNVGTGYKVTISDKEYIVVKLGDTNGDGKINSGDLFYTQKYLLKQIEFDDILIKACDVNKDNKINSGDLFYIQKYLLKQIEFNI